MEHSASAIRPKCPSSLFSAVDGLAFSGRLVERAPLNSWYVATIPGLPNSSFSLSQRFLAISMELYL